MALTKSRQNVIGSTQWVQEEREHAHTAVAAELADFGFSLRNELEWLNEKMADVFSQDPKTLTDILKTPGKLRGKTPRTLRKDAPSARKPLADIFAPNLNANTAKAIPTPQLKSQSHPFKVIEDVENLQRHPGSASKSKSPQRAKDSGYHGMTEDESDAESQAYRSGFPVGLAADRAAQDRSVASQGSRPWLDDTNDSFQSAHEDVVSKPTQYMTADGEKDDLTLMPDLANTQDPAAFFDVMPELEATEVDMLDDADDHTEIAKPSQQRKSSFNFSSLPAREPLQAKRSIGGRASFLDTNAQNSVLSMAVRNASGASITAIEKEDIQAESAELPKKSTAQRLHERITLLGKGRDQRMSTLATNTTQDIAYPILPPAASMPTANLTLTSNVKASGQLQKEALLGSDRPDLSSIAATASVNTKQHTQQKHSSVPDFSTIKTADNTEQSFVQRAKSLYEVPVAAEAKARTPSNESKTTQQSEGPLSASKNRLMSVLKSARSIFASSASASAAAKLEAHDASPDRQAIVREISNGSSASAAVMQMPGAMYSETSLAPGLTEQTSRAIEQVSHKQAKAQAEADLEHAREQERIKAAKENEERRRQEKLNLDRQDPVASDINKSTRSGNMTSTKAEAQTAGKLKAVGKSIRSLKDVPVSRPAPVNVKVGSQLKALQEPYSRPASVMRPSSALSTMKGPTTTVSNSRTRALEAASRRKELEEREKQRKAQQKKELERKRIAKADEDHKADVARKAEEQRLAAQEDAKRQQQHRAQHQRQVAQKREEDAQRARAAHELAEAIQKERAQQQAQSQKQDGTGTLRQLTAKPPGERSSRPPVNPAKPPKRVFDPSEEDAPPSEQAASSFQQNDNKRRKTNEKVEGIQRVSAMAPPKRPSAIRNDTLSRFPLGYTAAPQHVVHHPNGMFKAVVNNQFQMQQNQRTIPTHPSQTVQMSTARIAFADNSVQSTAMPSGLPETESAANQSQYAKAKTPVRSVQTAASAPKSAKSSPMFNQGDAISLPEIATDSEEEEDDEGQGTGFRAPSWVASPALRGLLTQQQLVDPESVFGPIAELKMEEVFRGAKNADRLKKFRDRGSSAAWIQNGDAVTSAEKRRDLQMRERVAKEGGWRYEPGL